jgi:methylated-DNA-[protein]-cysteine S-methyltransferase
VLIITGELTASQAGAPKYREFEHINSSGKLWQTVPMLEWTEVRFVDDLRLRLVASVSGLRSLELRPTGVLEIQRNDGNRFLLEAAAQLHAYFAAKLRRFDLPLDMQGTDFQRRVWRQLEEIPYGETRSYAQIANAIGTPKAVRAVGAANGANPIAIIVPCHRVIGSNGKLTGFGGGLPMKQRLLELEGAWSMALKI